MQMYSKKASGAENASEAFLEWNMIDAHVSGNTVHQSYIVYNRKETEYINILRKQQSILMKFWNINVGKNLQIEAKRTFVEKIDTDVQKLV